MDFGNRKHENFPTLENDLVQEMAYELNFFLEVISWLLKKLSDRGIVILNRTHIEIVDLDKNFV